MATTTTKRRKTTRTRTAKAKAETPVTVFNLSGEPVKEKAPRVNKYSELLEEVRGMLKQTNNHCVYKVAPAGSDKDSNEYWSRGDDREYLYGDDESKHVVWTSPAQALKHAKLNDGEVIQFQLMYRKVVLQELTEA